MGLATAVALVAPRSWAADDNAAFRAGRLPSQALREAAVQSGPALCDDVAGEIADEARGVTPAAPAGTVAPVPAAPAAKAGPVANTNTTVAGSDCPTPDGTAGTVGQVQSLSGAVSRLAGHSHVTLAGVSYHESGHSLELNVQAERGTRHLTYRFDVRREHDKKYCELKQVVVRGTGWERTLSPDVCLFEPEGEAGKICAANNYRWQAVKAALSRSRL